MKLESITEAFDLESVETIVESGALAPGGPVNLWTWDYFGLLANYAGVGIVSCLPSNRVSFSKQLFTHGWIPSGSCVYPRYATVEFQDFHWDVFRLFPHLRVSPTSVHDHWLDRLLSPSHRHGPSPSRSSLLFIS